jgi:hypothetical protein
MFMMIFMVLALMLRGKLFLYQLLQFLPLVSIIMGRSAVRLSQLLSPLVNVCVAIGLVFALSPIGPYYKAIGQRLTNVRSVKPAFYSDFEYKLADIINKQRPGDHASMYVCGDLHVLHILTDTAFIPYIYHSNAARWQALYDRLGRPMDYPRQYYAEIDAAEPTFLVLFDRPHCHEFFDSLPPGSYERIGGVGDTRVYQLKKTAPQIPKR